MSIVSRNATRNQITYDYDKRFVQLGKNEQITGVFVNETGAELVLVGGEVLAKRASGGNAGKLVAFNAANTIAGDCEIVGINLEAITLAIGAEAKVLACNKGRVDEGLLVFIKGETLNTIVAIPTTNPRSVRDKIAAETAGIDLVVVTENTKYDN